MGGPQGQVLRFLDCQEQSENLVLIKDIEQELNITKSVASNLVKRMVQNGLVELEASPSDKRAKFVRLTDKSRSQMKPDVYKRQGYFRARAERTRGRF